MWEKRGRRYFPCRGTPLPNEPVSQYRRVNLPKTDDNDRTHKKMMQTPYLHIWLMLLSGNVPHRTNSSQLFWNGIAQKKKTNRVCVYVSGVGGGGC